MSSETLEVFKSVVNNRRSVRGFLDTPAPQELLNSVFELAQQAPSNCNTQPWQVYVASGTACETLRVKMPDAIALGNFSMDFPYAGQYEGVYKERQYDAAAQLYKAMGIERSDKEARNKAFMSNFRFFGAPHVAFLFLPEPFSLREAADLGMYAQNLMLSMTAHGLASCPQTALSFDANLVREELLIKDGNKLLFGISFGYEDKNNNANECRVARAPLEENVHFKN